MKKNPGTKDETQGAATKAPSRRRARLLLLAASVVFSLLAAEVALRVVGYSYPVFYVPDEELGYTLRPGAEGVYRREGLSHVLINSDGLRDREHAKEKPAGVFRIAVVGDSYAEALQVEQSQAFWSVMERRLAECPQFRGRAVEVINFGVSGYGTAQELLTIRRKVWQYSPDLVILAFTTNNDVTDNLRALKRTDEIPYFVRRDGRLVLDDSFRESRAFRARTSTLARAGAWVRDHSRVVQLFHQAQVALRTSLRALREKKPEEQQAPAPDGAPPTPPKDAAALGEELGIDNLVYREPLDATWEEAWAVTEELLAAVRDEVRAHGAELLVVTLSNGPQVFPDAAARAAFVRRVGATDLFYPDLRVKAVGEREGFAVLNLAPALQRYADENQAYLHGVGPLVGSGHWNELGHRVAGELLAEKICEGVTR